MRTLWLAIVNWTLEPFFVGVAQNLFFPSEESDEAPSASSVVDDVRLRTVEGDEGVEEVGVITSGKEAVEESEKLAVETIEESEGLAVATVEE